MAANTPMLDRVSEFPPWRSPHVERFGTAVVREAARAR